MTGRKHPLPLDTIRRGLNPHLQAAGPQPRLSPDEVAGCFCNDCSAPISPEDAWLFSYFGLCGACVARAPEGQLREWSARADGKESPDRKESVQPTR
jgi:hypothetical protein